MSPSVVWETVGKHNPSLVHYGIMSEALSGPCQVPMAMTEWYAVWIIAPSRFTINIRIIYISSTWRLVSGLCLGVFTIDLRTGGRKADYA